MNAIFNRDTNVFLRDLYRNKREPLRDLFLVQTVHQEVGEGVAMYKKNQETRRVLFRDCHVDFSSFAYVTGTRS